MPTHDITGSSLEAPSVALILSLGPSRDSVSTQSNNDTFVLGTLSLESIPRLAPLVRALTSCHLRHRPFTLRCAKNTTVPILQISHAECQLEDAAQLPLLEELFQLQELTSYDIAVPTFGPDPLRTVTAGHLETELTVRGELPSIYQFLAALKAENLAKLVIRFRRNLFEAFDLPDQADFGYSLHLSRAAYSKLRRVRLRENEEHGRFLGVSLSRILRPLFDLPHLDDVLVELVESPLSMDDDDISQIAYAWRGLRRLILSCARRLGAPPKLDSLYMLHRLCRELEVLVLPVLDLVELGTSIKESPPQEPMAGSPGHPLRIFAVTCTASTWLPDQQAMKIARCIDSLFPNIDVQNSWRHDGSVEALLIDWYMIWVNILTVKALRKHAPGRAYLDYTAPTPPKEWTSLDGYISP
ncbi:hypothetical protein BV20DRAFT_969915 [Pilatotrama ljubarskyi]|nr:hypothetical protein BV20DRAFT_969915 [Pilatotrama ljubarskyi]